jgi:hypothetical protein
VMIHRGIAYPDKSRDSEELNGNQNAYSSAKTPSIATHQDRLGGRPASKCANSAMCASESRLNEGDDASA